MSIPVNASISFQTPSLLTAEQLKSTAIQDDFTSPFLRPERFAIDPAKVLQPPAPPSSTSVDVHGDDGSVTSSVSYTPGDFTSMEAAAEKLMKDGNQSDYIDGQKLMQKAFQILQVEVLKASLQQQIFNSVVQSLQRAAG